MAILKITRTDEYMNHLRDITIFADEKVIGKIKNAEVKEFVLPAGTHAIYAKIDWCKSNVVLFTVAESETKNITLSGFSKLKRPDGFTILYYLIFASNKYLKLTEN